MKKELNNIEKTEINSKKTFEEEFKENDN